MVRNFLFMAVATMLHWSANLVMAVKLANGSTSGISVEVRDMHGHDMTGQARYHEGDDQHKCHTRTQHGTPMPQSRNCRIHHLLTLWTERLSKD